MPKYQKTNIKFVSGFKTKCTEIKSARVVTKIGEEEEESRPHKKNSAHMATETLEE